MQTWSWVSSVSTPWCPCRTPSVLGISFDKEGSGNSRSYYKGSTKVAQDVLKHTKQNLDQKGEAQGEKPLTGLVKHCRKLHTSKKSYRLLENAKFAKMSSIRHSPIIEGDIPRLQVPIQPFLMSKRLPLSGRQRGSTAFDHSSHWVPVPVFPLGKASFWEAGRMTGFRQ